MTAQRVLPENYRVFRVLNRMVYLGFPAHTLFIPLFFWLGVPLLGYFNIFSSASWLFAGWLNHQGKHWTAINLLTFEVVAHSTLATYCFGWESSFQTYLMPMITFTMINYRMRARTMLVQAAALVALYTMLYVFTRGVVPQVSPRIVEVIHFLNIAIVFAALCVIAYYFREASLESEKRMEQLASTDILTHLPNRRSMRETLELEQKRSERTGREFAIILTDIDYFKRVNDNFGHDCGDHVLRTIATRLRATLRDNDVVARWGGEEFLILLPEATTEGAVDAAERMRHAVANESIVFHAHEVVVTMTFGVALASATESIDACISRADVALYEGKRAGRNRVISPLRSGAARVG